MENQKSYYAIIPATIRYDENLSANAKLMYGEITALCNEKGYCWANNEYFSKLYNCTKQSISGWIKQLKDIGYIDVDIIRDKETNQVINRYIRLADPSPKNFVYPPLKILYTSPKNFVYPPLKNLKDNNTSNNTYNNTSNIKNNKEKKSKIDKLLDKVHNKCLEYDIEDEQVILELDKFFTYLAKDLVTDEKINANLDRLAKLTKQEQLDVIKFTLENSYKNINPDWMKPKSYSSKSYIHSSNDTETVEEHNERVKNLKNTNKYTF